MLSKKVIFTFSPQNVERPVTYQLIKDYNLWVNILQAKFPPGSKTVSAISKANSQSSKDLPESTDFIPEVAGARSETTA